MPRLSIMPNSYSTMTVAMNAANIAPVETVRRSRRRRRLAEALKPQRMSAVYMWLLFICIFGVLQKDTFLTTTTVRLVLTEGVITAVLALAFLLPFTANQFDLSIGSMMSFSLIIVNWIGLHTHISAGIGVLLALAACGVAGAVSGFLVIRLRINSFIATLAVSQVLTAVVIYISDNRQLTGAFSNTYARFGRGDIEGIPVIAIYLVVLALIVWFVLEQTPVGRYLFATGGNPDAARLAGVPTDRMIWGSLVASAVVAGFAGVLFSMKVGTFSTSVGPGYLFPAITAVFLGAAQFSQRPNVWGTLVAYFALAFGIKGLQLQAGAGSIWVSPLFEGVALVFAVGLAAKNLRSANRGRTRFNLRRAGSPVEDASAPFVMPKRQMAGVPEQAHEDLLGDPTHGGRA